MFGSAFVQLVTSRLKNLFGIGSHGSEHRIALRTGQTGMLTEMVPALSAGSVVVSFLLFALTAGTALFPFVVIWAVTLHAWSFVSMRTWLRARRQGGAAGRTLLRSVAGNLFHGILWAMLPVVLLPHSSPAVALTVAAGATGVLCAAGLVLFTLPHAALALALPVLGGTAWAVLDTSTAVEGSVLLVVLVTFAGITAAMGVPFGAHLVQRVDADTKLREQQEIISLLLKEHEEHSSDWLWETDKSGCITRVSKRFSDAAGRSVNHLTGLAFCDFLRSGSPDGGVIDDIESQMASHTTFRNHELEFRRDDGERHWRLAGKPVCDDLGQYAGYVGTASDITVEKNAQRRIHFLAHNDALTGLLNRESFSALLQGSVARLERYGSPFAILYLDLDQFKSVNDSRGHLVGDRLLAEVSRRIAAALRKEDSAARLGGDEFGIVLTEQCDSWSAAILAARLVEEISKPYEIDGEVLTIGVSIGIALAPINGIRPDQLLRNADLALYRAKAEGRGIYRFFEAQMDSEARERRVLEIELRQAIADEEFVLYYQPLVSTLDNRPIGFEALLRWNHPIRGVVSPAEFIPIAEQTGLILPIGDWTIRHACLAAATWPDHLNVAVNLSPKHFESTDIAAIVREALAESGLAPHRLEIEITEGLLIKNPDEVVSKLAEIKQLGVSVAIDDFGTGYSSLSSLLKFPFDKLKIDKSFVTASTEDAAAQDILRLISALGTTLKMRVTAEGVETQEQVKLLREMACHSLQGYYFSKPLDEAGFASYLLAQVRNGFVANDRPSDTPQRKAV